LVLKVRYTWGLLRGQRNTPAAAAAASQHADDNHVLGEVRQAGFEAAEEGSAEKRDLVTGEWNQPGPAEPEGAADGSVGTMMTMDHVS
jgi:hypothetical protein